MTPGYPGVELHTSLERLQAPSWTHFLLHSASDLLAPDGDALLDWLEGLRDRGLVERIGVSIYDASELERLPLDRLQLVQLPLSVYDQRLFLDGTVTRLHEQHSCPREKCVASGIDCSSRLSNGQTIFQPISVTIIRNGSEQQHREGRGPSCWRPWLSCVRVKEWKPYWSVCSSPRVDPGFTCLEPGRRISPLHTIGLLLGECSGYRSPPLALTMTIPSQRQTFLNGEGDAWFQRNRELDPDQFAHRSDQGSLG